MGDLIRQGEILLFPIPAVLFGNRQTVRRAVIGHSESGHHHVLDCDREFDLIVTGDEMLIELQVDALLIHEADHDQHRTLTVSPGTYRVVRKRRYDPLRDLHDLLAD